jgi:hypothetical protein
MDTPTDHPVVLTATCLIELDWEEGTLIVQTLQVWCLSRRRRLREAGSRTIRYRLRSGFLRSKVR